MLRSLMTVLMFFFTAVLHGQDLSSLSGKILIGERLEFFSILNDTTLHSSINSYKDTANFYLVKDILFIKQKYLQTDRTETKWIERLYEYKIDKVNGDTLHLKSINDTFNGTDSHLLVNVERLKENVEDFKFLRLVYVSPWTGKKTNNN